MNLNEIPDVTAMPEDGPASDLVSRIRSQPAPRRAVMKGLFVSAAAAALVPFDWALDQRAARAAGPRSEFRRCAPRRYAEQANNLPRDGKKICYGGERMGSWLCGRGGFHFEGRRTRRQPNGRKVTFQSYRLPDSCEGKNAWRWTYRQKSYRCSDATTKFTPQGGRPRRMLTISACRV